MQGNITVNDDGTLNISVENVSVAEIKRLMAAVSELFA